MTDYRALAGYAVSASISVSTTFAEHNTPGIPRPDVRPLLKNTDWPDAGHGYDIETKPIA